MTASIIGLQYVVIMTLPTVISYLGDTPTGRQPAGRHESVNWATASQFILSYCFCVLCYIDPRLTLNLNQQRVTTLVKCGFNFGKVKN